MGCYDWGLESSDLGECRRASRGRVPERCRLLGLPAGSKNSDVSVNHARLAPDGTAVVGSASQGDLRGPSGRARPRDDRHAVTPLRRRALWGDRGRCPANRARRVRPLVAAIVNRGLTNENASMCKRERKSGHGTGPVTIGSVAVPGRWRYSYVEGHELPGNGRSEEEFKFVVALTLTDRKKRRRLANPSLQSAVHQYEAASIT